MTKAFGAAAAVAVMVALPVAAADFHTRLVGTQAPHALRIGTPDPGVTSIEIESALDFVSPPAWGGREVYRPGDLCISVRTRRGIVVTTCTLPAHLVDPMRLYRARNCVNLACSGWTEESGVIECCPEGLGLLCSVRETVSFPNGPACLTRLKGVPDAEIPVAEVHRHDLGHDPDPGPHGAAHEMARPR